MTTKDDPKLIELNKIFTKKHKQYYKCIDKNCKLIDKKLDDTREDYAKNLEINCPSKNNLSDLK